eukprot:541331-Heterocapsa_arctica.AAC.1
MVSKAWYVPMLAMSTPSRPMRSPCREEELEHGLRLRAVHVHLLGPLNAHQRQRKGEEDVQRVGV